MQTFVLRRTVPPAEPAEQPATRGIVGALGRKVLQVLVFRAVEEVGGRVARWASGRWEEEKRPYRLRGFEPDSFQLEETTPIDAAAWDRLGSGPALLMLHGTFSRAHSGFAALQPDALQEMHQAYAGRVFAFDHYTLSETPDANVDAFLARVPAEVDLELDVVAHSRGGLVARSLGARHGDLSAGAKRVRLRNVVFVACPNGGTALADAEHMRSFVDRYTNLLSLLPDTAVLDVLATIVDVIKHLAVGALDAMPGLSAMRRDGDILSGLRDTPFAAETRAFGLAADYEPASAGRRALAAYARDGLMDRVFGSASNDLVVPTSSCWDLGGGRALDLADRHVFETSAAVDHTGFFGNAEASSRLVTWLTQP
ncbi:esterase/lipase family protein [Nocardioides immobilis]|nr:alpha/beta hydrolase [Nocardioides immobilis]